MVSLADQPARFGDHLRWWRRYRRLSQLDLAGLADVSSKHLSFLETGRSSPSREMVLHLARHLEVPVRHQNGLLVAAGYAARFAERSLGDHTMAEVRRVVDLHLEHHEPYPAICEDRRWDLLAANGAAQLFLHGVAPELLDPPINVVRISLHPAGLAPRVRNFNAYAAHLLGRLRLQAARTADPDIADLLDEVSTYVDVEAQGAGDGPPGPMLPLRIDHDGHELALISTIATIGAPLDITTAELAIEAFYPADPATASALARLAGASAPV